MSIEKSGLSYINKMARMCIEAVETTIGSDAMQKIYIQAGVPLELYPPPNDFAKTFDFAYFSSLMATIDEMYGLRGARGLAHHSGKAVFAQGWAEFAPLMGVGDLAFKAIPLKAKLAIGLRGMAETFSKFSDQRTTIQDGGAYVIYTIHDCPVCWGRQAEKPVCHMASSLIDEGVKWVSGGMHLPSEEVACRAMGAEACVFHIPKEEK